MLISVTDLSAYLFCPRKLYARKVLGIREPPNQAMALGTVRHETYDFLSKIQEALVRQTGRDTKEHELFSLFKKDYLKALKTVINQQANTLQEVDLVPGDVFVDVWPHILEEAKVSSRQLFTFAQETKTYGEKLWERFTPKVISEYHVSSQKLQLKGIIDRIEITGEEYVPIELKTGRPPREGVWPGHRTQVAAYELLLQEAFDRPVTQGYVRYLDFREDRPVVLNPFIEAEVGKLIMDVQDLIQSEEAPAPCGKRMCNCATMTVKQEGHNI